MNFEQKVDELQTLRLKILTKNLTENNDDKRLANEGIAAGLLIAIEILAKHECAKCIEIKKQLQDLQERVDFICDLVDCKSEVA